ncbi:hypothetical protein E8E11_008203 [Didymella keratinophila]|nr:hypothetical protein E8E11_008203 [Didymella keratinophila]
MALRFLQQSTAILTLFSPALAQTPSTIPPDLSASFTKEVQVSFSNNAVTGFASGTTFPASAVSNEPTFALGDSNGISPSTLYTLLMVDTTCPNARTLHYLRSNFKFAFAGGTNIETDSAPLLDYKPPGAFQEKGDRQYVFLMYTNPQRREIREVRLPAEGEAFDVKTFQADNGLNEPVAGVGMVVQLSGTADCEGGDARPSTGVSSAAPASTSRAGSTAIRSSAVSAEAPSQTATSASAATSAAIAPASSSALSAGEDVQGASSTSAIGTQAPESSSPALQTDETEPSTVISTATLTSVRASNTESPTTSGGALEQTANAAAGSSVRDAYIVPALVLAGAIVW